MIPILYEDSHIQICEKQPGTLSESSASPMSLPLLLQKQTGHPVFALHRLDQPVGGAIMYAKNRKSAGIFARLLEENGVTKIYQAVLDGVPEKSSGELHDFLFRDSRNNKTFVVKNMRKGVKEAVLTYQILHTKNQHALAQITLATGRTHQIRVQFASRKTPVTGDGKYGSRDNRCQTALWSYELRFRHPILGKEILIRSEPPKNTYPWNLFKTENKT